jgi:hypothetical protein
MPTALHPRPPVQLSFLGAAAKSRLSITFINQLGHQVC